MSWQYSGVIHRLLLPSVMRLSRARAPCSFVGAVEEVGLFVPDRELLSLPEDERRRAVSARMSSRLTLRLE